MPTSRIIRAEDMDGAVQVKMERLKADANQIVGGSASTIRTEEDEEQALKRIYEIGYRNGLKYGRKEAEEQRRMEIARRGSDLAARVDQIVASFEHEISVFEQTSVDQVIDLAIELARQLMRQQIKMDRSSIIPIVRQAMNELASTRMHATLLVHPDDEPIVSSQLVDLLSKRGIDIHSDHSIEPGGCRITGPLCDIDATVQTRWRRVLSAVGRHGQTLDTSDSDRGEEPLDQPLEAAIQTAREGSDRV